MWLCIALKVLGCALQGAWNAENLALLPKKVCLDKGGERDVGRQGGNGEFLKQIKIAHALCNASNFKGGHVQQFSSAKTEEMCDSRETFLSPFSKFSFFIGFCAVALSRFHFGYTLSARKRECPSL